MRLILGARENGTDNVAVSLLFDRKKFTLEGGDSFLSSVGWGSLPNAT